MDITSEKLKRGAKVLIASYAVAVGVAILAIVIGLFLFGGDAIDNIIEKYSPFILLVLTILSMPFVSRFMK